MEKQAAKHAALEALPKKSTAPADSVAPLVGSRWQVIGASVMLAVWIVALVAMAVYSG
jgi:uncharacterized membrane protein